MQLLWLGCLPMQPVQLVQSRRVLRTGDAGIRSADRRALRTALRTRRGTGHHAAIRGARPLHRWPRHR